MYFWYFVERGVILVVWSYDWYQCIRSCSDPCAFSGVDDYHPAMKLERREKVCSFRHQEERAPLQYGCEFVALP